MLNSNPPSCGLLNYLSSRAVRSCKTDFKHLLFYFFYAFPRSFVRSIVHSCNMGSVFNVLCGLRSLLPVETFRYNLRCADSSILVCFPPNKSHKTFNERVVMFLLLPPLQGSMARPTQHEGVDSQQICLLLH